MQTARRSLFALLGWLCAFSALAQAPAGYYDLAQGKTGDQLKAALYTTIKGHTMYPYSSTSTDVWDILKEADKDPNNPNNVIGIYSGFSMDAAAEYDNGAGWNREHVWAKSRGDFGTTLGAGTDLHHLRAEDVSTNSARNNRNFDEATEQYIDGSGNYSGPTGSYTSSSDWIWEPRAEVKGDVARMLFYMTTRYEGENGEPDLELIETYLDNTSKEPYHAKLSVLIQWHLSDPVDASEVQRNNVVYSYQGNRNPYIDHPEWVCEIWPAECGGSTPTNNAPAFASSPLTSGQENVAYSYNVVATDADGDALNMSATTLPSWLSFTVTGNGTASLAGTPNLSNVGTHTVSISATDGQATSYQTFSITVEATGSTGGGSGTELIISEYVEGSSYNKGLEIANITGSSVNLSAYSLKKQTNGAGAWSSGLALSGSLASGDVFVVVHSSAITSMQTVADISTGVAEMSFNGNDAVGLFKNDVLIDIVGVFNSTATFGQDVTLIRNADISSPNTSYTTSEWTSQATDYVANLGSHTFNGGGTTPTVCNDPSALAAAGIAETSVSLSWSGSANSFNLRYRPQGTSTWLSVSTGANSQNLSGLAAATTYEWEVMADCGSGSTSNWVAASFRTLDPAPVVLTYCDSYGQSTVDEWLQRVTFAGVNNTSGNNGGYADYTSISANVNAGSSYSISLYPAWSGRSYREAYDVWADWNQDGDFADAGEYIFSAARTTSTLISGSFSIPSDAKNGTSRMRISMKYNQNATACEIFSYGEVEDYSLNISGGSGARTSSANLVQSTQSNEEKVRFELFPNPAGKEFTILLPESDQAELRLIDLQGRTVLNTNFGDGRMKLATDKIPAGIYQLLIRTEAGNQYSERLVISK